MNLKKRIAIVLITVLTLFFVSGNKVKAAVNTSFMPAVNYGTGELPCSIATGDFNGDGRLDLAIANNGSMAENVTNMVSILTGAGDGTFNPKADYDKGESPCGIAAGDFNGDRKLDLAVTNSGSETVSILMENGDGTFNPKVNYGTGDFPYSVITGDFNGDGKLDLVVANGVSNTVSILTGNGDGTFNPKADYDTGNWPNGIATGDFNRDGKLDIAVANYDSNTMSVLTGNGDGTFNSKADYGTGDSPSSTATGDFNGDGKLDLAIANEGSNTVSVLTGNGDGTFNLKEDYGTGDYPESIVTGDFNGDGMFDLAVANFGSNTISVLTGNGDGTFNLKEDYGTGEHPYSVITGDFNGDGMFDLAVANFNSNTVSVLINNIAAKPTASPAGGAVAAGSIITLSSITTGAVIHYTMDGSIPTASSTIYTAPITVNAGMTIKAIAVKPGMMDSSIMSAIYTTVSAPVITVEPENATVIVGQSVNFNVTATGEGLSYQWKKDGAVINNATDSTLKLSNVGLSDAGKYSVVVTNAAGSVESITATLKVNSPSGTSSYSTGSTETLSGSIIDQETGRVIEGAEVTLYYAKTDRNKEVGLSPDTIVALPVIDGFKQNSNSNPQVSDASGAYGFMVYTDTDYYIISKKDRFEDYKSPTISIEKKLVKWDLKMNKPLTGVNRIFGSSRIDTAIEIAKSGYTQKIKNVILATANNYPDALSGSVLAYKLNAPVLLVGSTDSDIQKVTDYIKSNMDSTGTVYILGGTGVIGSTVENKITSAGFSSIIRLEGADRYETAVKVIENLDVQEGTPVVLVNGDNYPDALSASSEASIMGMPILLVDKDGMSDAVKNEISKIKPSKIYAIGLQGVISDNVLNEAASIANSTAVRIGGTDRYETSVEVAKYFNLSGQGVCIATGNDFPDALAGSVYAANHNAPIILAGSSLLNDEVNYLKLIKINGATIFGGEGAVSKAIEEQLSQLIEK